MEEGGGGGGGGRGGRGEGEEERELEQAQYSIKLGRRVLLCMQSRDVMFVFSRWRRSGRPHPV